MKLPARLKMLFSAVGISAALCAAATADPSPLKPEDASKHFAAVSKHLESGGLFYSYIDIDGDFARLAATGDRLLDILRRQQPSIPEGLKASKIVDALGLNAVKAIGLSSRGLGKDLYHNRALVYMPDGPKGLMKLFGGKPAPYQIGSFAPADAGMAVQMELTLGALVATVEEVIKSTGDESAVGQFKAALSFPVPGLNMSVGEFIGKLNTRVMAAARFEEGKKLSVPGAPFQIPGIQFMIALDDIDFVMQPLLAMLAESDAATIEIGEGFTIIRPSASFPGDLDYFRPGLYHDQKSKRIILTSHLDMAKNAGGPNNLAGSEAFRKATAGLPAEGNGMTYVTPQFVQGFTDFYAGIMKEASAAGGSPEGLDEVVKVILDMFPPPSAPIAGIYANVPEGMLFVSNMNENHKHTLVQAAVVPLAFVAGAVTGFAKATATIRDRAEEAPRAQPQEREEPEPADKAVKNNLQQIAFAAQTYFIDNPKQKTVTYEALVKAELIFDLDPVMGESYKGLSLKREGGGLSVKTKGGGSVSVKYEATSD